MNSPQQQALMLIEKYAEEIPHKEFGQLMERDWSTAKQCALIDIENQISLMDELQPHLSSLKASKFWNEKYYQLQQTKTEILNYQP